MAELTLGVLGLAGLFSVAMEVWGFVEAGQGFERSASSFYSKIQLQRQLFVIWGHNMGFKSSRGYDRILDEPGIRETVGSAMLEIFQLLSDTEKLSAKYGIRIGVPQPDAGHHTEMKYVDSSGYKALRDSAETKLQRMRQLTRGADAGIATDLVAANKFGGGSSGSLAFQSAALHVKEKASVWTKASWALRDDKKASKFVEELTSYVSALRNLTDSIYFGRLQAPHLDCIVADMDDVNSVRQGNSDNSKVPRVALNEIEPEAFTVVYEPGFLEPVVEYVATSSLPGWPPLVLTKKLLCTNFQNKKNRQHHSN